MARTYPVRPVNPLCFLLTTSARKRVGCPLVSMASTARRTVLRAPPSRFTRGTMAAATRRASSPSNQALRSPRSIATRKPEASPPGSMRIDLTSRRLNFATLSGATGPSAPASPPTRTLAIGRRKSHARYGPTRANPSVPTIGVRFHRRHLLHTTHSRPFAGSNASRRPTGNSSTTSFEGSGRLQNMHVVYMGIGRAQLTRSEGVQRGPV